MGLFAPSALVFGHGARIAEEINSTINGHADLGEVLATIEATDC
jgi:hypothetical protein